MKIIISPAKKMNVDTDSLPTRGLPQFLPQTQKLLAVLKGMDYNQLKKLWKCNDAITQQNVERLERANLTRQLTPAILAYEGLQYQYMAPSVFTDTENEYIQRHLRILSGFYGVLRPFDGVIPYRLEMQTKLAVDGHKDLYSFWGKSLAESVSEDTNCIINLASKEYSIAVEKHLAPDVRFITVIFGEEKDGKVVEKGTACKMARGEMVRFMAEQNITTPDDIKTFTRQNYKFCEKLSTENTFVFIRKTV